MGIKVAGFIFFNSTESVGDNHEVKTIHRLYNKKLFHSATFLHDFSFFSCEINIKKTIQHCCNEVFGRNK